MAFIATVYYDRNNRTGETTGLSCISTKRTRPSVNPDIHIVHSHFTSSPNTICCLMRLIELYGQPVTPFYMNVEGTILYRDYSITIK